MCQFVASAIGLINSAYLAKPDRQRYKAIAGAELRKWVLIGVARRRGELQSGTIPGLRSIEVPARGRLLGDVLWDWNR